MDKTIFRKLVLFGLFTVALNIFLRLPLTTRKALTSTEKNGGRGFVSHQDPLQSFNQATENSNTNGHDQHRAQIQTWREKYMRQCQDPQATQEDLQKTLSTMLQSSTDTKAPPAVNINSTTDLIPCDYTVLDFGANIGDSLGKLIDSYWESCPAKGITKHPRLDLQTLSLGDTFYGRNTNILVRLSRSILQQVNHRPEEYCYYGVEGNPRFTSQLQSLEHRLQQVTPRPIRRVHFLTETVGAGVDGPTVLYLDTVNKEHNFWGSSIMKGHRDVQRSVTAETTTTAHSREATEEQTAVLEAPVQGITLTTLLPKTVQKVSGAHLLIKMDIEGGEYAVLEEAHQSGILCDFAQAGVTIHLILETHRPDVIGMTNFDLEHWRHVKNSLKKCGVKLLKGRDAGR